MIFLLLFYHIAIDVILDKRFNAVWRDEFFLATIAMIARNDNNILLDEVSKRI